MIHHFSVVLLQWPRQCGHIADLLHRWEEATSIVGLPAQSCWDTGWIKHIKVLRYLHLVSVMLSFGTGTVQFPSFLEVDSVHEQVKRLTSWPTVGKPLNIMDWYQWCMLSI
jgi:hypothetical protein